MELAHKKCLVVGLGVTGIAVTRFLIHRGASVTIADSASEKGVAEYLPAATEMGARLELGAHRTETFTEADLIVLSPGVPETIEPVRYAKEKGILVTGEIELASRFIRQPIVAVTGTNGKTTTTALLGEMLKASGLTVFVGGNIGNPLIRYAESRKKVDRLVAEISSFQLDTIETFRPDVAVLLNISEDHLDRYPDFDAYVRSKGRIFENQRRGDAAVFNGADPNIERICKNVPSRKMPFFHLENGRSLPETGAVISGRQIFFYPSANRREILDVSAVTLPGRHNIENVSAAGLAALAVGGSLSGVREALGRFKGLSHRMQHVTTVEGVSYINDSKATNMDATARAIDCIDRPLVLILGGRNKGGNFITLRDRMRRYGNRHIKLIINIGEAKEEIEAALKGTVEMKPAASLEDAVGLAYRKAAAGDVVMLSPACASFDMFGSYAERGDVFCRAVKTLKRKAG
jgi:UDP-N-acetylmuramoylalanine--D-glutamate ligase